MGIEFGKTFGAGSNETSTSNSRSDQPKAQVWLNIGFIAQGAGPNGDDRFVSLPVGIPLDTQEPVNATSRNADYGQLQAARNDLLAELLKVAGDLEPGQDCIVDLQIQMRRVSEDRPQATVSEGSPYARKGSLVALVRPAE